MSKNELDRKVDSLRELRNLEAEVKAEISSIEADIKAEMISKNTDQLVGTCCTVTWKTVTSRRFDSAAFKLVHRDLFERFCRESTSRRFLIA